MTFVLVGLRGSGNFSLRSEPTRNEKVHALQPGTSSSSFSRPSGGQDKRGGGGGGVPGCTWCCVPGGFLHSRGGGGGECLWTFVRCTRARLCLFSPFGSWGVGGCSVAADSPARAASSVASPRSSQHARRRGESGEVSEDRSIARSSRASRSLDRGARKDRRARSRLDSSRDRGRRSRSRSSYRSRSSGRRRSSSRSLSSRKRLQSSDRLRSRRVRSRSRGDRSRRDRSRSSDRYQSRRQHARSPARRGACGHAISLVVLVDDFLPPLTVRGQRRKDGEPDESSRRVWRR